jgi:hypothetical protein
VSFFKEGAMKRVTSVLLCVLALGIVAAAASKVPPMPRSLSKARFVYVAAYDGDQADPGLLPADREAIAAVQGAIQKWGKLTVVNHRKDADLFLMVQSRPGEDVLAVYDAHGATDMYLWRVMGRDGLKKDLPLVSQFENAWEQIAQ